MYWEELLQDLKFAMRTLRKNPGFTAVVVTTLALGIGANTTIFSLMSPYLLRPLPYGEPDQLVQLHHIDPVSGWNQSRHSPAMYEDWRERSRAFEDIAAYYYTEVNLTGAEGAERVEVSRFTANLLPLLQVEPALGRGFAPGEDGPGAEPTVLLDHGLWQRRYGGDRGILGRTITIDGVAHTVLGVMPEGFRFPFGEVKMWLPVQDDATSAARDWTAYILVGRLNEGWTRARALEELSGIHAELAQMYPDADGRFSGVNIVELRVALNFAYQVIQIAFVVLIAAVTFVLLIACVNVASLTLVRAGTRAREVAVRAALGAGRSRIIRQLVTESALLAVVGGAAGIGIAYAVVSVVGPLLPEGLYRVGEASIDGTVLAFSAAITGLTPLFFGLAPALTVSRPDLTSALKEGSSRAGASHRTLSGRRVLVVAEVALAMVLVIGAGLMLRSFAELSNVGLGFESDSLLTARTSLPVGDYEDGVAIREFYARTTEALGAEAGVVSAATVSPLPLNHEAQGEMFVTPEQTGLEREERPTANRFIVSTGYFQTMRIPLHNGRDFTQADGPDATRVVVVNQVLAERYPDGASAVGRTLLIGEPGDELEYTIIGLAGNVQHESLDGVVGPQIYFSHGQRTTRSAHLVIRTQAEPNDAVPAARRALSRVDPGLPIAFRPMSAIILENTLQWSATSVMLGLFGLVAVGLAALGIYGVISYSVSQRRTEIGVRVALGASSGAVRRVVLVEGLKLTGFGIGLGMALGAVVGRVMASILFGVSPFDPVTFGGVLALFLVVALASCLIPALRAGRVSPTEALRYE